MLNLTQHNATEDQLKAGVTEPEPYVKKLLQDFLTFKEIPSETTLEIQAKNIAYLTKVNYPEEKDVMIGGAPFFMSYLEDALKKLDFNPYYAFSKRVVKEKILEDGTVEKTAEFKFEGFVKAR